jgi:hypothetical protein
MLSYLEIRSDKNIKIGILTICTNTLSYVQNCIAVITYVDILLSERK